MIALFLLIIAILLFIFLTDKLPQKMKLEEVMLEDEARKVVTWTVDSLRRSIKAPPNRSKSTRVGVITTLLI